MPVHLILRQILFAETLLFYGFTSNFFFAYDHLARNHSGPDFTPLNQLTQVEVNDFDLEKIANDLSKIAVRRKR